MVKTKINVFSSQFGSDDEARAFCDWDYSLDEDDPTCKLADALQADDIDVDFVEAIYGDSSRFNYVENLLVNKSDLKCIKNNSLPEDNTLIVVMEIEDNKEIKINLHSDKLTFCGRFDAQLLH